MVGDNHLRAEARDFAVNKQVHVCPHFADGHSEAQKCYLICPRSHSHMVQLRGKFRPDSKARTLCSQENFRGEFRSCPDLGNWHLGAVPFPPNSQTSIHQASAVMIVTSICAHLSFS